MNFILQTTKIIPSCHKLHSSKWAEPNFCEPLRNNEKHGLRVRMALSVQACKIHPQQQNNFFPSQWSRLCTPPTVLNPRHRHPSAREMLTSTILKPQPQPKRQQPQPLCILPWSVSSFRIRQKETYLLVLGGNPAAGQSLCDQSSNRGSGTKS